MLVHVAVGYDSSATVHINYVQYIRLYGRGATSTTRMAGCVAGGLRLASTALPAMAALHLQVVYIYIIYIYYVRTNVVDSNTVIIIIIIFILSTVILLVSS